MSATRQWVLLLAFSFPISVYGTTIFRTQSQTNTDKSAEARSFLNQGVEAFKKGLFDEAVLDFQRAKELDPSLLNARLYLATAYANLYIPGVPSAENLQYGQRSLEEFRGVLEVDPNNLAAIDGIGSILYNIGGTPFDPKKLAESKNYHEKHIALRPEDPEPYYWIGVIDWTLAFRSNKVPREEYNRTSRTRLADSDPMPPPLAARFRHESGLAIEEGILSLERAMDRRPDYDDAMAYLNLERSKELRDYDLAEADDLVDKVKALKMKKMDLQPEDESEKPN